MLSLEAAAPLASFDAVGFTLAHELIWTNVLEALDLSGIALTSAERDEDDPIILAGGPSAWNCEPMAPVFDAVLLGDGEEFDRRRLRLHPRRAGRGRLAFRAALPPRRAAGSLRPLALRRASYDESSTRWGYAVPKPGTPAREVVLKSCIPDLAATPPVASTIVPYMGIVQDRLSLEVLRGCARGCRFCQAGMTYRPVQGAPGGPGRGGGGGGACFAAATTRSALTSLSTTDHSQCAAILNRMQRRPC